MNALVVAYLIADVVGAEPTEDDCIEVANHITRAVKAKRIADDDEYTKQCRGIRRVLKMEEK